jgi:hypothetical protein
MINSSFIFDEFHPGGLGVSEVIVGLQAYNNITDDQVHTIQRSRWSLINPITIPTLTSSAFEDYYLV